MYKRQDQEEGTRDARIWMMTLHSAKGLEFPTVVLAGLEAVSYTHLTLPTSDLV